MTDHTDVWNSPRLMQVRALEDAAAKLAARVVNEIGPGEAADKAYDARVALSRILAPYRRAMAEQFWAVSDQRTP